ncbi:hypothetical protein OTU49_002853, partial [Cherax quadricarinatus]
KGVLPHQIGSAEAKVNSKVNKTQLTTSISAPSDEPPPPPPRSISLPSEPINSEVKLDANSLDNLSIDSIVLTQIPERSSPDGEDSGNIANIALGSPGVGGSDADAWSSDWEEMQDAPVEHFSNVLLSLNEDEDDLPKMEHKWEVDVASNVSTASAVQLNNEKKMQINSHSEKASSVYSSDSNQDDTKGSCSANKKSSSSMKLNSLKNNEITHNVQAKRTQNLGEEFDVLAIKVNKKHDSELDLFADLVPKFNTKKFDLETLLMEANCKVLGIQKVQLPSVSETLAGLDTSAAGDGWGEGEWGEQIDMFDVSPSNTEGNLLSKPHESPKTKSVLMSAGNRSSLSIAVTSEAKDSWNDGWSEDF